MVRSYSTRFDVIRNGATLTTLNPVGPPAVDCDANAALPVSMGGIFHDNPLVDWLNDEIKPYQIVDGQEYAVGVFPVGSLAKHSDEHGTSLVHLECYDRTKYLNETKTEKRIHLDKGSNYINIIEQLLTRAGVILYLSTKTTEVLATDREDWEPGTPYLQIINQLLEEINYEPVWFNADGLAVLRPIRTPNASNIDHQYTSSDDIDLLFRRCKTEVDVFDAPNVFLVVCNNPDLPEPLTARAINENPLSLLAVSKRNRRILKRITVDNIPNQEALEVMANRICTDSMLAAELVTISTANVPEHGVRDTVAIIHPDVEGIFQEVGWHLLMEPGAQMIHTLRRSRLI